MTKIVFFGSSEYSTIILNSLLTITAFSVVAVVTKSDKPMGRDQTITPNPVAKFATDHHLSLHQIEIFDSTIISSLSSLEPDLGLCVAFGPPFFSSSFINLFPQKIINIHPSPLPKYRGATPGPWQIINDETTSAITFFQIDELPDHGPIICQIPFDISPTDTADSFYQKAFTLASQNLAIILNKYLSNIDILTPQDHSQKTYFSKLDKNNAKINWQESEQKIERTIRALSPWPIAWTEIKNKQGKILKMKILSAKFDQKLILDQVQIEGKTITLWPEIEKYYQIIK